MHALKGITALQKEEREIRSEISKLQIRLTRINAIYDSINRLVSGKTPARKTQAPRSKRAYVDPHSLTGKVFAIVRDLDKPVHVKVLAKQFFKPDGDLTTTKQNNCMSNACKALTDKGMLVRVRRGVFRTHEAFRKAPDTKAEIGHDTRISQVSNQTH